ncbi:MAG: GAF domain-containing protein, partial [Chitinophagaceae bacterium]
MSIVMPLREFERIKALKRFLDIEFTREPELQKIVEIAAEICECPIALITLIDEDKQHIRFRTGTELQETKRSDAFCNHTIRDGQTLIVANAELDGRFTSNPLVTGEPNIRFYAGAPLVTVDGESLGSLCVIDTKARLLSEYQKRMLEFLRGQAMNLLEFEASVSIL